MNVVFDLGGVLLDWNPNKIIKAVIPNAERHRRIHAGVFEHPDWHELDRGVMDPAKAIDAWVERAGLTKNEATALVDQIPRSLVPIPETQDLLQRLSASDTRLFCLSNMHTRSIDYIEKTYSFWKLFSGTVISCRIHVNKPDHRIYQHLLKTCGLTAEETVFIDDTADNVEAAKKLGIAGIQFDNAEQCETELRSLGCQIGIKSHE